MCVYLGRGVGLLEYGGLVVFYRGGAFSHGGVWCGGRYGVGGARVLYAAGVGVCVPSSAACFMSCVCLFALAGLAM